VTLIMDVMGRRVATATRYQHPGVELARAIINARNASTEKLRLVLRLRTKLKEPQVIEKIGCPNPFELELRPQILQAGERLSAEIANIQNGLRAPNAVAPGGYSSLAQVEAQGDPKPQ
jgi:hypothetical protein